MQRSSCFVVPSPRTSLLLKLFGLGFVAIAAEEAGNLLFPVGCDIGCVCGALVLLDGGCASAVGGFVVLIVWKEVTDSLALSALGSFCCALLLLTVAIDDDVVIVTAGPLLLVAGSEVMLCRS